MAFRNHLEKLEKKNSLIHTESPVSKSFEAAGLLKQLEPLPVFFHQVKESPFRLAGNLLCSKTALADYFGIQVNEIIPMLTQAIEERRPCQVVAAAKTRKISVATA